MVTSEGFQDLDGTPSAPVTIQSLHQGHGEIQKWTCVAERSRLMWQNATRTLFPSLSLSCVPLGLAKLVRHVVAVSGEFTQYCMFCFVFKKRFSVCKVM